MEGEYNASETFCCKRGETSTIFMTDSLILHAQAEAFFSFEERRKRTKVSF